jgi:hypothetical protein
VGGLHQAPNGNIEPNGIVCTKVQRSDQKRIEGARNCERWRETLDRILTAGDDDWIVGPEPVRFNVLHMFVPNSLLSQNLASTTGLAIH